MSWVWPVSIIIVLFIIFLAGPLAVSMFVIFSRRRNKEELIWKPYFEPYRETMISCSNYLTEQVSREQVTVLARDGAALNGFFYDGGSARTVIMAHGYNSAPLSDFSVQGKAFLERGWNVLMISQRAHGYSGGKVTLFGLLEQYDVMTWAEWVHERRASDSCVIYGMSMGCAATAYASDKLDPEYVKALVLDCGYTSPFGQISIVSQNGWSVPWRILRPFFPVCVRLLFKQDIRTPVSGSLSCTDIPAIFLHGEADSIVPVDSGRTNYAACASVKKAYYVPDADHTMSFLVGGSTLQENVFAFLDKYTLEDK